MKKGTFPLNGSMATEEELFLLKRESHDKRSFLLNESKATDEKLFILKRKSLEKKEAFR